VGDWLVPLAAALVAALPGLLAYRQATRANRDQIEAGAYERAKGHYESGIDQLEEQVGRLRRELDEERTARRRLEDTVTKLRRLLILHGIEVEA
jgi:flagellar biosynthesis chaperone FliJ